MVCDVEDRPVAALRTAAPSTLVIGKRPSGVRGIPELHGRQPRDVNALLRSSRRACRGSWSSAGRFWRASDCAAGVTLLRHRPRRRVDSTHEPSHQPSSSSTEGSWRASPFHASPPWPLSRTDKLEQRREIQKVSHIGQSVLRVVECRGERATTVTVTDGKTAGWTSVPGADKTGKSGPRKRLPSANTWQRLQRR